MILINRGREHPDLAALRLQKLDHLRALGREPTGRDIHGYRGNDNWIAQTLCKAQHYKCCYCEYRVKPPFNHVEHYRPKGRANRAPGCKLTHGYWWLAFTWDNLMFACSSCNSPGKGDQFPLADGSTSLKAEHPAPGHEVPLLLNPGSSINPVEHIIFIQDPISATNCEPHWRAHARNNSNFGGKTIAVCKLNCQDLLELRSIHIALIITPQVVALKAALAANQINLIQAAFDRAIAMLTPRNEYVALSYDAFRHFIPDAQLQATIQKSWPTPDQVGR
jgi:hypothetical protein